MTFMSQHGNEAGPKYTSKLSIGEHIVIRITHTKQLSVSDTSIFHSNSYTGHVTITA